MKKEYCPICGKELVFVLTPNSVHYGKLVCPEHGYVKWVKYPKNEGKRRNTSKYDLRDVAKFHGMKEPICFFCLRNKDQLGENETLTVDHIIELQQGGKDELPNLQILCSACHKLKNWRRLYGNWHLFGKKDYGNDGEGDNDEGTI